jgi:hypothetical protein
VLLALAIDSTYWLVRLTDIPLFASERATMRIAGVPLVWLLLMAAIAFQQWWDARKPGVDQKTIYFITFGLMLIDLWSNLKVWRPVEIKPYFEPVVLNIAGNSVVNHIDLPYTNTLLIGLGLTLTTALFLFYSSWREVRKESL